MINIVLLVINDKLLQKERKRKRKISFNANPMSLADYFDLIWGFHNDLWRSFVLFDNT